MEARTVVFNSVLTGSWRLATVPLPLPAVRGFLRVVSPTQLAFADYRGNRQMLSTGNLAANDRVALFLMDYPRRERLKILGHARIEDARQHPELVAQLGEPEVQRIVERLFFIEVIDRKSTRLNSSHA